MQFLGNFPSAIACVMDNLCALRYGKDTGHLRVPLYHTAMDDSKARFRSILSYTPYRVANLYRVHGLSRSMVCLRYALDVYVLVCGFAYAVMGYSYGSPSDKAYSIMA